MMSGLRALIVWISIVGLFLFPFVLDAQEVPIWPLNPSELVIEQVATNIPDYWVYLRVSDQQGNQIPNMNINSLTARTTTGVLSEFNCMTDQYGADYGVAITLIVDISLSVKGDGFKQVQLFAQSLLNQLREKDRIMLILAGDQVVIPCQFSNDFNATIEQINALSPKASNTLLFDSVKTANRQNLSRSADLPHRRVIVIISDGFDEGSGVTLSDLEKEAPYPIFAIAYNQGKKEYVTNLKRLTTVSGGHYFHLSDLKQAEQAGKVLIDLLKNTICLKGYALEPEWFDKKDTIEIVYKTDSELRATKAFQWQSDQTKEDLLIKWRASQPVFTPEPSWYSDWKVVSAIGLGLLVIVFLGVILFRKRAETKLFLRIDREQDTAVIRQYLKKYPKGRHVELVKQLLDGLESNNVSDDEAMGISENADVDMEPPRPILAVLTFVEIEGENKGRKLRFEFRDEAIIIGRDPMVGWRIEDEQVSGKHAKLSIEKHDGKNLFVLEDLFSTNGTMVNGIKIESAKRIVLGDVIWISKNKFRFLGEES